MKKLLAIVCLLTIAAVTACYQRVCVAERQQRAITEQEREARLSFGWAALPLTGDDSPYRAAKESIDAAIAHGESPTSLVALSDVAAQAAPQDALIQFKRAYAAWRSLRHNSTLGEYYQVLNGVPEALAVVPYPRCYNFARLRFLVEFNNPQLISLGEGLLQTNPKDNDVKYKLVSIYGVALAYPSTNGNVKAHALKYATDLIQSEPNNSNDYSACASIYLSLWDRYHDKPDGDKAVAYYEQYLRLAPPDAEFRRMAQKFINEIQKDS